ncbi:ribose 5-phosphate isomerase B [Anaerococcus sp.]|uniref:ribose 5-phosphate isomerase B n=1 Tax=Anaerococcus sp. TaxID=1872515 RepID=UPI002A90F424|nr:ribose 5-phosphate isomerase B [Anaerococcus sp.]MDY6127524.1 ribose 5-phosphate isomerase B [Anaerococcus sp.]
MKIAIGCDHTAIDLKETIKKHLQDKGHEVEDVGTYSKESCDYPLYGFKVANKIKNGEAERGVLICGTGVGISLAANKVKGIRAVVCSEPYTAKMARMHNNAQIVAMGARVVSDGLATDIVDAFMNAEFEGGRHQRRVDILSRIEETGRP